MDKENAKVQITILLDRYKHLKEETPDVKSKDEEKTKTKLIRPLFEHVLGWNFEEDVTAEEKISRGWVDYGFRINDVPKFFLEAKGLKEQLDKPKFFQQAYSYAYYKRCPWVVLTNFETIEIINAESEAPYNQYSHMEIKCEQFLDRFDDLWLLSREGFEQGLLDKLAEKFVRRSKRVAFDKQLLNDFTRFRDILSKSITKLNHKKNLTQEQLDESVQRILNRLIFIRNCEDKGLEESKLWEAKNEAKVWKKVKEAFEYYDKNYDSKLFTYDLMNPNKVHLCDSLDIDDSILREILDGLYQTKDRSVIYNFRIIDANVLGNVYEQYLSHILKKTEKTAKLSENHMHRKEQGIYYTPTYVVDYIVENTIGELIKNEKTDIRNIRVLDPACGSGSFLIKAFDELNEYYQKNDKAYINQASLDFKADILFKAASKMLQKNIFGVDLDVQAVEITQLNLLMRIAEQRSRLPILEQNIKCGNSLIDDVNIAGDKAFNWEQEFKEIMQEGGFDVIIGNPPYVDIKQLAPTIVKYLFDKYDTVENRMNLYSTFVHKAFSLLKEGGYFGFIIPNSILYNNSYAKIRKLLLSETTIEKIVRLPDNIFEGAKIETVILIYRKKNTIKRKTQCEVCLYPRDSAVKKIGKDTSAIITRYDQSIWEEGNGTINITSNPKVTEINQKIEKDCSLLIDVCHFSLGLTPYDKYKGHTEQQIKDRVFHAKTRSNATFKPLLSGENITRYSINWDGKEYISYGNWLGAPREKRFFTQPHIVVRQIISGKPPRIYAGYTEDELYNTQIGFNLISRNEEQVHIKYILAIVNSKLIAFYHREKYLDPTKNLFQKILIVNAKNFPIRIVSSAKQEQIIGCVDKMLSLKKRLIELNDKMTDERAKLEGEILKMDSIIDELIYSIYGLSEDEKKFINDTLK